MTGLVLGAIIISFASIMVTLAGMPPDVVGFYRLAGGGLGLFVLLWGTGGLNLLTRRIWKWSLFSAVFFAADFFFWHRSIGLVGPGLATMLVNFQAVILACVSIVFLKERVSASFLLAMGLTMAGLYCMVGVSWDSFSPEFKLGIIFGLLTALAYALYLLSLKFSVSQGGADPLALACAVALCTAVLMGGLALAEGESFAFPGFKSLAAVGVLGLGCHAGGWYFITRSMQRVRTSLVGLILLLQPTLSYVWDTLLFDKVSTPVELVGVGLALIGIYLGSSRPGKV
ncbi:EamA family transporter [Pseudodesulfovibrio cashew]|uniref:EamA family transporter n=1 Tax=Pseudodesulfovibrio cashew TaxID=2678688 RepID=A0A6I6JE21_9BACT|nr:DMT family transporter [Pseudodesulfovibrio cashew]QGY39320.1 EamA family transporter [Pseudodesulfovibrio cashew]